MDEEAFSLELHRQLAYWQEMLFLRDWNIELRIARQWDMLDSGTLAQCQWYIQRKDAIITVLHPDDLEGCARRFINGEECDYDISLVHELLHLHFAAFHRDEDETAHEQVINAISRGMVKVWRTRGAETPPPASHYHPHKPTEGYL